MSHSWQHGIRYSTLNYYAVGILDALSWDGDMGFYDEEIKGESHSGGQQDNR